MVEKKGLSKIPSSARSDASAATPGRSLDISRRWSPRTSPRGDGEPRDPDISRRRSPRNYARGDGEPRDPDISRRRSPRNSARGVSNPHDVLSAVVREAVKLELAAFFGNGAGPPRAAGCGAAAELAPFDKSHGNLAPPADDGRLHSKVEAPRPSEMSSEMSEDSGTERVKHAHFRSFTEGAVEAVHRLSEEDCRTKNLANILAKAGTAEHLGQRAANVILKVWTLQEPDRTGCLANIVFSPKFERTVQLAILFNCIYLGVSANAEMTNVLEGRDPSDVFPVFDICFLAFYTMELILKLAVHRAFFFWNSDAGYNSLDLFLVMLGFFDLVTTSDGASGSTALRTVRILKMGKALRALRVISRFRKLRAILVCIQGSIVTLFWSVLMLLIVIYLFSLIFVQQATNFLVEMGPHQQAVIIDGKNGVELLTSMFGSVEDSMLTLAMAAFGGEDWGVSYNIVSQCGWICSLIHLAFIAFTQIALINIITGIFVDSAMQNLAPGKEAMALELQLEEQSHTHQLAKLCLAVDDDNSGRLTPQQFAKSIEREKFPMLLNLLGLNRVHVEHFFELLSSAAPNGEVEIHSFVQGCMRLKGAATSFDLQMLMVNLNAVKERQIREFRDLRRRLHRVEVSAGTAGENTIGSALDPV